MNEVAGVILMVLTSCGQMDNGEQTGVWLNSTATLSDAIGPRRFAKEALDY